MGASTLATRDTPTDPARLSVKTLRGTTFNASTVASCLSAPTVKGAVPAPVFTKATAPAIKLPTPCNICVDYPMANGSGYVSLLPKGTPDWTCEQGKVGCMDMCETDASGKPLRILESAATMNEQDCGSGVAR